VIVIPPSDCPTSANCNPGLHAIIERNRGEVGGAAAATGQIDKRNFVI
jgi:hypothetical protein